MVITSYKMSDQVKVIKADDIGKEDAGYTKGMSRKSALVGCSEKMCSLVMDAEPNSSSAIHHHGDQGKKEARFMK